MPEPSFTCSIAALQGKLNRRYFKPWNTIAKEIGYEGYFRSPQQRARLQTVVRFAANICSERNLDPSAILLKINDDQESSGCIVKAVGKPDIPLEIRLKSQLFSSLIPETVCQFVIAHEFGHILNGDTEDARCLKAVENSLINENQLTKKQRRERAYKSHLSELAADKTAVSLFTTKQQGINAGITSFELRIAEYKSLVDLLCKLTGKGHTLDSACHRFNSHPTPQLRIRMLRRLDV